MWTFSPIKCKVAFPNSFNMAPFRVGIPWLPRPFQKSAGAYHFDLCRPNVPPIIWRKYEKRFLSLPYITLWFVRLSKKRSVDLTGPASFHTTPLFGWRKSTLDMAAFLFHFASVAAAVAPSICHTALLECQPFETCGLNISFVLANCFGKWQIQPHTDNLRWSLKWRS